MKCKRQIWQVSYSSAYNTCEPHRRAAVSRLPAWETMTSPKYWFFPYTRWQFFSFSHIFNLCKAAQKQNVSFIHHTRTTDAFNEIVVRLLNFRHMEVWWFEYSILSLLKFASVMCEFATLGIKRARATVLLSTSSAAQSTCRLSPFLRSGISAVFYYSIRRVCNNNNGINRRRWNATSQCQTSPSSCAQASRSIHLT